jgi:hypothetical protein
MDQSVQEKNHRVMSQEAQQVIINQLLDTVLKLRDMLPVELQQEAPADQQLALDVPDNGASK